MDDCKTLGTQRQAVYRKYRKDVVGIPKGGRTISRADVADFLLQSIVSEEFIHQSVALSD